MITLQTGEEAREVEAGCDTEHRDLRELGNGKKSYVTMTAQWTGPDLAILISVPKGSPVENPSELKFK